MAKGKLGTPVIGIALGVPLNRVSTGPFYQFQTMDGSEGVLTKLLNQLARRVQNLELVDVVKTLVQAFKATEASILKTAAATARTKPAATSAEETAVEKLVEQMKSLPSRVAERLAEEGNSFRGRKRRRFHPMMFEEMMHMGGELGDPVAILMVASLMRDDAPWLYELAMEVYRAVQLGDAEGIQREMERIQRLIRDNDAHPYDDGIRGQRIAHHRNGVPQDARSHVAAHSQTIACASVKETS